MMNIMAIVAAAALVLATPAHAQNANHIFGIDEQAGLPALPGKVPSFTYPVIRQLPPEDVSFLYHFNAELVNKCSIKVFLHPTYEVEVHSAFSRALTDRMRDGIFSTEADSTGWDKAHATIDKAGRGVSDLCLQLLDWRDQNLVLKYE